MKKSETKVSNKFQRHNNITISNKFDNHDNYKFILIIAERLRDGVWYLHEIVVNTDLYNFIILKKMDYLSLLWDGY